MRVYSVNSGLHSAGAKVAITGRDQNKIETALAHLGEQATGTVVDASSLAQVRRFFHEYGPFHHLVIAVSGAGGAGRSGPSILRRCVRGLKQNSRPMWLLLRRALRRSNMMDH